VFETTRQTDTDSLFTNGSVAEVSTIQTPRAGSSCNRTPPTQHDTTQHTHHRCSGIVRESAPPQPDHKQCKTAAQTKATHQQRLTAGSPHSQARQSGPTRRAPLTDSPDSEPSGLPTLLAQLSLDCRRPMVAGSRSGGHAALEGRGAGGRRPHESKCTGVSGAASSCTSTRRTPLRGRDVRDLSIAGDVLPVEVVPALHKVSGMATGMAAEAATTVATATRSANGHMSTPRQGDRLGPGRPGCGAGRQLRGTPSTEWQHPQQSAGANFGRTQFSPTESPQPFTPRVAC
jgi:hypothetical protein